MKELKGLKRKMRLPIVCESCLKVTGRTHCRIFWILAFEPIKKCYKFIERIRTSKSVVERLIRERETPEISERDPFEELRPKEPKFQ